MARSTATQSVSLATVQPLDPQWLSSLPGIDGLVCEGDRAKFRTTDITRTLAELLTLLDARRIEIAELQVRKATLEDVFIELTGASLRD
jgi:hypothetical protein